MLPHLWQNGKVVLDYSQFWQKRLLIASDVSNDLLVCTHVYAIEQLGDRNTLKTVRTLNFVLTCLHPSHQIFIAIKARTGVGAIALQAAREWHFTLDLKSLTASQN